LLREVANKVKKNYLNARNVVGGLAVILMVFCSFLLYLGATFNPAKNLNGVKIGILNLDQGFPLATVNVSEPQLIYASAAFMYMITQVSPLNSLFDYKYSYTTKGSASLLINLKFQEVIMRGVKDGEIWGAIVISEDYSSSIFTIGSKTDTDVIAQKQIESVVPVRYAVDYYYDEGRNQNMHSILNKTIVSLMNKISLVYAGAFTEGLPASVKNLTVDPYFTFYPLNLRGNLSLLQNNLFHLVTNFHPVGLTGQNFITYLFAIMSWIGGMSVIGVVATIRAPADEKPNASSKIALYGFRILYSFIFALACAFAIAIVYWIFAEEHNAGLVFLWAWFWILCVESIVYLFVVLLSAQKFSLIASMFLILQVTFVTNIQY
jgi:hypothetical protein